MCWSVGLEFKLLWEGNTNARRRTERRTMGCLNCRWRRASSSHGPVQAQGAESQILPSKPGLGRADVGRRGWSAPLYV